jgi:CBS domain-containing protein
LGLLLVKLMIWVIALGSGTSGGVLAPLLMIGAGLGSVLGSWLPGGGPELWALVCMAAILAGTMRAPLTAVVFARRGRHVYREYGVDPLERHFVDEVMTRDPLTIAGSLTPDEILHTHFGKNQRHRAYPVVADGQVVAMMDRNTLNDLAQEARDRPVAQRFADRHELVYALPSDTCRAVALKLAAHGLERLPVVSDSTTRELTGIISRSDLLKPARALHEEEVHRESFFWSKERNAHQKSS